VTKQLEGIAMGSGKLGAVDATGEKYKGTLRTSRAWTLCLGAGVARGIFPDWSELARNVVNEAFAASYDNDKFRKLVSDSGWSLDAWIQAAANEYLQRGKTRADFIDLIESQLYGTIRSRAASPRLANHIEHVLNTRGYAHKRQVAEVCEFFEAEFAGCSLLQVIRFLLESPETDSNPCAVLTFNADTLLETLLSLFQQRQRLKGEERKHDVVYYSLQRPNDASRKGVPIYHCHGAITPRSPNVDKPRDSRDRLVFLEEEYLKVASSPSMWPASAFLFYAETTRMVFAGLSMADPNIRRWMSSAHAEERHDLQQLARSAVVNPTHLWIQRKPQTPDLERIRLVALTHLGIRPAWISGWDQLYSALKNLLASEKVPPSKKARRSRA
jgi:hypothetical protein